MIQLHELKVWPEHFQAVWEGNRDIIAESVPRQDLLSRAKDPQG